MEGTTFFGLERFVEAQERMYGRALAELREGRKHRSSMTLFDMVSPDDVFGRVLEKYYGGKRDSRTVNLCRDMG